MLRRELAFWFVMAVVLLIALWLRWDRVVQAFGA